MSEKNEPTYAGCAELFPNKEPERRFRNVDLPIKDVTVRIRSLFAGEVSKFEMTPMRGNDGKTFNRSLLSNANARLIVLCLVDQAGNQILNPQHVKRIEATWDHADIATLYQACVEHCGVNADVEDIVKNLRNDDSQKSDSPDESAE
jgi:hypothetical protein